MNQLIQHPPLDGPTSLDLGTYRRDYVTNCSGKGKLYFDLGLNLMLSYQHELASASFYSCLHYNPNCALAHGLIALCHSPNYNFKGGAYYYSACHYDDVYLQDIMCVFPSQQVADRHSKLAIDTIEELRKINRSSNNSSNTNTSSSSNRRKGKNTHGGNKKNKNKNKHHTSNNNNNQQQQHQEQHDTEHMQTDTNEQSTDTAALEEEHKEENKQDDNEMIITSTDLISDMETQLLYAIRTLTCQPGVDPGLSEEIVGRPYADAMAKVYAKYPNDPEIAYFYAESLMVLNAWQLYEYPSGKPASPDVITAKTILERSLEKHPQHAGLCHMYVHLCEMSSDPGQALVVCESLRFKFPHAGHLVHMATHIDVLVGDYDKCVSYNRKAVEADLHIMKSHPAVAGTETFYFNYIAHDYIWVYTVLY